LELRFNPNEKESVVNFAKKLKGKTLRNSCESDVINHLYSGKGNFGQVLEKYYFGYEPNSVAEPDFPEIGMELKSSPLKEVKVEVFRAKERLVLNIINYFNVVNQEFETSDFYKKNSNILLVFYLYESGLDILDFTIKLVDEWSFTETDLEIIKKDWEIINKKIIDGKAHELSEGDTFYLGACTKGANSRSLRKQPNSEALAMQRAYSFKMGYVNHIIATIGRENEGTFGKIIASPEIVKKQTLEEIVISKFTFFLGKTPDEIVSYLDLKGINKRAKNYYSLLTKAILGIQINQFIEEFEKAEIIVKTVRINEKNTPKEDISFPNFEFKKIVNEEWEESDFKNVLEHKFFFVFFQYEGKKLFLRKVKFWNMPYTDILKAEKVWFRTKDIVTNGQIVKQVKNGMRYTNFPGKSFNNVAHVRPHARNSKDTFPLPFIDKYTNQHEYTKHCFWINKSYVRDEIYLNNQ